MRISVLTAALPTRGRLLAEAIESVHAQTLQPVEHLIGIDYERRGSGATRNALAAAAAGEWLAFLDDDDFLYASHLQTLAELAEREAADVTYAQCVTVQGHPSPVRPFDADALQRGNFIPATVLIRAALFRDAGGFPDSATVPHGWEDWALWKHLHAAGARFAFEPAPTWVYRLHPGSKTLRGEAEAY